MEADHGSFSIEMWGYLPGSAPHKNPIVMPTAVLPPAGDGWKAVCSGGCGFAISLSDSGKLYTWGSTDEFGQSCHLSGKFQEFPEAFPLKTDPIVFAAAGWAHCAAVTHEGAVHTWGWKECIPCEKEQAETFEPEPGKSRSDESYSSSPNNSPRRLLRAFRSNRTNEKHVGTAEAIVSKRRKMNGDEAGSPDSNGHGAADESMMGPPCCVCLPTGVKVTTVATGGRHTLALTDTGQVWGWGYGGEGQLGLGSRSRTISSPQQLPLDFSSRQIPNAEVKIPGSFVVGIAAGGRHSALITDGGGVLTFGWGLYGQCGQGSTEDEVKPCYVSALGGVHITGIAAGLWHTVCISNTGDVYAFGGNQFGQLGVGGDQAEIVPKLVEAVTLEEECVVSVSCGARHSVICTNKGKVFCWGWNKYGQLGVGDRNDRDSPTQVCLLDGRVHGIACGWWHTLALVFNALP